MDLPEDDDFLNRVIDINPINIDEHFRRVPAELAYYNNEYANAVERFLTAKMNTEKSWAQAYKDAAQAAEVNGKKITVAALNAEVELTLFYQAARAELASAEADKQRCRGKVETVSAKKEMLISLGAHLRSEMTDPMVRKQVSDSRETRDS